MFLSLLAVENTASMLARRYAVGVIHLKFSKNAVLAMNELMKMAFSIAMVVGLGGQRSNKARITPATSLISL